ncbi:MAG: nitroreductase/quinone reductase family protein [Halobacteriales archaeon]
MGNDAEGYVETRGPPVPDIAYRILNPVMSRLLRSPLHPLVSDSIMLLTFTGSKTGTEYTTPVGYWVKDGHLIVTTQSQWWHNLKGGQPVSMQVRGQHRQGIATPHPDPEDAAQYIKEFINLRGTDAARRLGILIRGDREPTLDELEAGVEGTVVIDIELTDDKPPVR